MVEVILILCFDLNLKVLFYWCILMGMLNWIYFLENFNCFFLEVILFYVSYKFLYIFIVIMSIINGIVLVFVIVGNSIILIVVFWIMVL